VRPCRGGLKIAQLKFPLRSRDADVTRGAISMLPSISARWHNASATLSADKWIPEGLQIASARWRAQYGCDLQVDGLLRPRVRLRAGARSWPRS
jgi:hypothetical protein